MNQKKKSLKVLQILPRLDIGGVERGTVDVARFLKKKGHIPFVVSAGGRLCSILSREKIHHIKEPVDTKNPFTIWLNAKRLKKIIKTHGIDIVHARSRAPAWSAYLACKETGTPFLTTFHGTYNFSNSLKRKYNSVMTFGWKIIAPSKFIKKHICEHYAIENAKKITVIPRGINMDFFTPKAVDPGRLKRIFQQFQLPLDKKIILLPGRITRWKGHHVLLEALTRLEGRNDFFCIFLGSVHERNRGYYEELVSFVTQNNLSSAVGILEENDDMASFYKMAHVVISASTDPEAFGRIMAEAGALGTPVIASNHGGAQEIIIPKKTGWLFEPGDSEALAACLKEALDCKVGQYRSMGKAAMEHVGKNFSIDQMLSKTLAVYKSLVK